MKKDLYAVLLDGCTERVLALDIYGAISQAKALSNKKNTVCESVEFLHEVYFTSKLKPVNRTFKVTIDHLQLNSERVIYYVIARGVTYAAKLAMKIHSANSALTDKEKKGLFVVSCIADHVIYT
jgi:hypothetical protein